MNAKFRIALGAGLVLVAVAVAVFFATGMAARYFNIGADYTQWPQKSRTEMMPEKSPEWLEKHFSGKDGKEVRTEIIYRNGDTGERTWRKDHTLESERTKFADGRDKLVANYAKDGKQVISGFSLRDDGTTIWEASIDKDNVVTTATYWYDGKTVFSTETRKQGDSSVDVFYFHKNGKPWVHFEGSAFSQSNPKALHVWDANGTLLYSHEGSGDNSSNDYTDSYYRADGTLEYRQSWHSYTSSYGGEYGDYGGSYTSTALQKVELFDATGKKVVREIDMNGGGYSIDKVTELKGDGSKVVYTLNYSDMVTHVDRFDKSGKQTANEDIKEPKQKLDQYDKYTKSAASLPDPVKSWKDQENDPSLRTPDAP